MFPLKRKEIGGYSFGVPTSYSAHHLGVDYRANYDELFMPFDGHLSTLTGREGGKTIWIRPYGQNIIIRLMHLSEMVSDGVYQRGQHIGVTGNTGTLSTAPHLHLDISKNNVDINNFSNFIDPEKFNWGKETMTYPELVSAESTLSDPDKHRLALAWAYRSIEMREPDQAKLDWLVAHYSDINVARRAMIDEAAMCPVSVCPPCNCEEQVEKALSSERDRIVNNLLK